MKELCAELKRENSELAGKLGCSQHSNIINSSSHISSSNTPASILRTSRQSRGNTLYINITTIAQPTNRNRNSNNKINLTSSNSIAIKTRPINTNNKKSRKQLMSTTKTHIHLRSKNDRQKSVFIYERE